MKNMGRLIPWTLLIPVFTIVMAFGMIVCVINNWDAGFDACGITGLLLMVAEAVCALVLLFSRKFGWFFGHLGLLILVSVIWFMAMIIMALGQHHPPKGRDEVDTTYMELNTLPGDTLWEEETNES